MIAAHGLDAFTEFNRPAVIAVGVPVMILAGIATYFNSRASVARQSPEAAANPQTAMMNKLALYVFPLGVVVGGPFLPLAIILYWFANNIWTFGQQHYVFGNDREGRRGQEAGGDRAPGGERAGARGPSRSAKSAKRGRRRRRRSAGGGRRDTDAADRATDPTQPTARRDERRRRPHAAARGATQEAQTLTRARRSVPAGRAQRKTQRRLRHRRAGREREMTTLTPTERETTRS